MESESEFGPAVAALAEHDRVAQRARASAVSREYALLLTGADALTVVYLATFLFAEVAVPGGAVLFAAFAATTPWEFAPTFGALISLPVMMAMLLAWVTPFGAARLGYEWRRIHWLAFAWASTAVFASVLLAATVPGYSWPASVALAVIGAAPLCASAFVTLVRR